jgi:hypothetical protein
MSNSHNDMNDGDSGIPSPSGLPGSPGAMEAFNMGGGGHDAHHLETEGPAMRYVFVFGAHRACASFC